MSNVGRNDPCPCGSGKKYKKCCLSQYEESINASKLRITIISVLSNYAFDTYRDAFKDVLGKVGLKELSSAEKFDELIENGKAIFPLDWFIFNEYVAKGKTPLELFLEQEEIQPGVRDFLENWDDTYWSFYEVKRCIPALSRVEFFDIFLEREFVVFDPALEEVNKGEVVLARLIPYKDFYITSLLFAPLWGERTEIVDIIKERFSSSSKENNVSIEDSLKLYGYKLYIFYYVLKKNLEELQNTSKGQNFAPRVIYKVTDPIRVSSTLKLSPYFVLTGKDEEGEIFDCIMNPKGKLLLSGSNIIIPGKSEKEEDLGSIMIKKDSMVAIAPSKEKLDALKDLINEILSTLVVYKEEDTVPIDISPEFSSLLEE